MPENANVADALFRGIAVSEGIAIGKAVLIESPWDEVVQFYVTDLDQEILRYKKALREAEEQLIECRNRVRTEIGNDEAEIFEAHLSILKDPFFQEEVIQLIKDLRLNAEHLLKAGVDRLAQTFEEMKNPFFQQRIDDIHDVAIRMLRVLLQTEEVKLTTGEPMILVAHKLTPSDTARMDREHVLGFVTEMGGTTSHVAILARSMGIPAIIGVEKLLKHVSNGDTIILDGNTGIVHIDPHERVVKGYRKRQRQLNTYWMRLTEEASLESITQDNVHIGLYANISMTADVSLVVQYAAEGIGLFRTELPFLIQGKLLSEEEQYRIYKTIVESMNQQTVTIRTLDLGGDKFLPFQGVEQESNPFLGWRSIRIFLQEQDIFKAQLRAILRASHYGNIRILYPMISSVQEIEEIGNLVATVKSELRNEKIPFDETIECGVMVEVPSAAIIADRLIEHTDFFSLGTNDLIQYTLAVDRNNEKVARFYQPLNPAVLRLIQHTVESANKANKPVSICGEIAGNPIYTALLLGLGLRSLSMSPLMLLEVKERIRAVTIAECEALAQKALEKDTDTEINDLLREFHQQVNKKQSIPYWEKSVDMLDTIELELSQDDMA